MNKKMLSLLISLETQIGDLQSYPKIIDFLRGAQREALIELQDSIGVGEQGSLTLTEQENARNPNGKIPAIRLYRERTKCDFITAKHAVEKWMMEKLGFTSHPYHNPV